MTLDSIRDAIEKSETIVIYTHENPDGDAVGSSLAMYHVLKQMGKNVDIVIPKYPNTFKFLPGSDEVFQEPTSDKYELGIALDDIGEEIVLLNCTIKLI